MFIKEIIKNNKGYDIIYKYYRLVESYRIGNNTRHRTILNLGNLDISKEEMKILSDRIESIISGQSYIFPVTEKIEELANHFAQILIHKKLNAVASIQEKAKYENVDIKSINSSEIRTIGAEYIGISTLRKLGLERLFEQLGFSKKEIKLGILSIVGTLVRTGSEKAIREWAKNISSIDELLDTDFSQLSNNALYRTADKILSVKEEIEKHLQEKEKRLFDLKENIILYDLTNTYIEGSGAKNKKAFHGRSKEKRYDRPLVTLGLVIDELGFPKRSEILKGNINETKTLKGMIEKLTNSERNINAEKKKKNKTIVMDAGIATEDNIKLLREEGYDYICVSRKRSYDFKEIGNDSFVTIKEKKDDKIEVKMKIESKEEKKEKILFCWSLKKEKKEKAMKTFFQKRFENSMEEISQSLKKKGGTKNYEKVLLRIGRLKEKNFAVAHYYKIEVKKQGKIATKIAWSYEKKDEAKKRIAGTYYIRTNRMDLDEKDLWSIYRMLTEIEEAFKVLKMELNLRPIHHQKTSRTDAHIFITLLAYHLLISIKTELRKQGYKMRWENLRNFMSTHERVTTSMTNDKGQRIHIRSTSEPEDFHKSIYHYLGLSLPDRKRKTIYL